MNKAQYIFDLNSEFIFGCHTVIIDGIIQYSKAKNFEQFKQIHKNKNLVVLNEDEYQEKKKKYLEGVVNNWMEITYDRYTEMLEVLPPMFWRGSTFFLSELTCYNISAFFCKWGDKYYTSQQRRDTPLHEIKRNLCKTIKENAVKPLPIEEVTA